MAIGNRLFLLLFAVILLLNPAGVWALPSSNTDRSGNLCERKHNFSYNYNFTYPQKMEVGKSYDLQMAFTLSGSEVAKNPPKVTAQIVATGLEVSETSVSLESKKKIQIKPLVEKPSLSVKTVLILNGNTGQHRGYKATYQDTFKLENFSVATVQSPAPAAIQKTEEPTVIAKTDVKEVTETVSITEGEINQDIDVQVKEPSKISWYLVRGLGLVAYLFLALSVLVALMRKISPAKFSFLINRHCDIAYLAIIFSFLHLINNLWDKYEWSLELKDLFWVDFSSQTRIMLSLGVIAFYLMLLVVMTSISPKIMQFLKYKKWHFVHLFSYGLYIFVVIHAFFLGTDLDFAGWRDTVTFVSLATFWGFLIINLSLSLFLIFRTKETNL
jgi:DMSO/TMAO reductase YedYZ heme-binding membrane subunit